MARKSAEAARRKSEEDQKRDKDLADAAARLQAAQEAYQAEVDKAKAVTTESTEKKSASTGGTTPLMRTPIDRHGSRGGTT